MERLEDVEDGAVGRTRQDGQERNDRTDRTSKLPPGYITSRTPPAASDLPAVEKGRSSPTECCFVGWWAAPVVDYDQSERRVRAARTGRGMGGGTGEKKIHRYPARFKDARNACII